MSEADLDRLAVYAAALADGIAEALPTWVERVVRARAEAWQPGSAAALAGAATAAGLQAAADVGPRVAALLALDVDQQRTGPLAIVRDAVRYPTEVLVAAGVPPVERDPFVVEAFPDDRYGLAPASFADLDPDLAERGVAWGAAKAHVVLSRRRSEGRR